MHEGVRAGAIGQALARWQVQSIRYGRSRIMHPASCITQRREGEMEIDTTTEFGARAARRLREEVVIWLTTTRADGTPQPVPVWFLWDGETFLIYSQPNQQKLRNIERNPKVALNLDGDGDGGDIIVLTGTAAIDEIAPPAVGVPAYLEKYREPIAGIGMTPERFAAAYSVAIRVTPTRLRGF